MNKREIWVDNIKVFACILVVLGHFFQSMVQSNILPSTDLYLWFNQTIYYFHVPLFFICSGFLYQNYGKVHTFKDWGQNILHKLWRLGVPYLVFSFMTWGLKTIFSGAVNNKAGEFWETLFLYPLSPYWYLYALFLLFLITPTFRNRKMVLIGLGMAIVLKIIYIYSGGFGTYAIVYILSDEIWFVMGMFLSAVRFHQLNRSKGWLFFGIGLAVVFIVLSVMAYKTDKVFSGQETLLGFIACIATILVICYIFKENVQSQVTGFLAQYTMSIFLMHTLFAAPLRIVLLRYSIKNPYIHVILGIFISFAGPILVAFLSGHGIRLIKCVRTDKML